MNSKAFVITELRLTGSAVIDAKIVFVNGLNVISGPSDTGKTFIFQCINYMLGATKKPKVIPESEGYTKCYLQINSPQKGHFTLERSLSGGAFKLYSEKIDNISNDIQWKKLLPKHNKGSKDSISYFLLSLIGIEHKKVRTNAKGKTRFISYRDISRLILVDEEKVITEGSPLLSGQVVSKTVEESVFRYLVTGVDDSDVIEEISKDDISHKKGKIELLSQIIEGVESDITDTEICINDIDDQNEKVEQTIQDLKHDYDDFQEIFKSSENDRVRLDAECRQSEIDKEMLVGLIERSAILNEHYSSDINRLRSTIEATYALGNIDISLCPLCESEVPPKDSFDLQSVVGASLEEISKIEILKKELAESVLEFSQEVDLINNILLQVRHDRDDLVQNISSDVKSKISKVLTLISQYTEVKLKINNAKLLLGERDRFRKQQKEMERYLELAKGSSGNNIVGLTTAMMYPLMKQTGEVFTGCKFPNFSDVTFSELEKDIVISGKDRKQFGKGFRAILRSIFLLGLFDYLKISGLFNLGFIILDSPLVTYKKPKLSIGEKDVIPENMAMDFYEYLATRYEGNQAIIIENTPPPEKLSAVNHIAFSRDGGFIPKKQEV